MQMTSAALSPHREGKREVFPEVGMPQGPDGTSKCSKINERLENRSTWPMVCTGIWPMRTPLRANPCEGGEGIPNRFNTSRQKSARKNLREF